MPAFIQRLLQRFRYGEEIVIVSGLPRSGTSMLMKMLEAGGLDIMTDNERTSDEDNPKGYYEFARVKDLENDSDLSWVREGRGKCLKVISHLLKPLPANNFYRVILLRRNLDEILASQNIMLERRGNENPIEDEKAKELYRKHMIDTKVYVRRSPNFALLEIQYGDIVRRPEQCAAEISEFLNSPLDTLAMANVVDPDLYRNRHMKTKN